MTGFHCFPQYVQANTEIVAQIRPYIHALQYPLQLIIHLSIHLIAV
jgi:hypothetical protein